ncbi:isocitrate/isopropylmalate dehydrogenase family protein [Corynebacterium sp. TAE3-ERU12]|uniref:isocitrate/isopropylmalate family dehydrogenase n=1 Tax=Corynebacterium sp. TAE3-ERU12 TaxID=2849491 RepID=UPI001C44F44C|nr:isocitrate/isopropylmalate family dehydrogenase [Corynebacterium sp. TAE3-ERU12]MBV7294405.1 isocitrate/isopropylmalate dehydrogenase family protein [Corynebacterium sp. TAE3-ERU12]
MTDRTIAILPGDGIGPELADACAPVLADVFPGWQLQPAEIGWRCWCSGGDPVPAATWRVLESADAALLVAVTSKPARAAEAELAPALQNTGLRYRSPVLQLRTRLDLHANIRPIRLADGTVVTIARENTEGLYAHDLAGSELGDELRGIIGSDVTVQHSAPADLAVALRVTTRYGWARLLRTAASLTTRGEVTIADKPNILQSSGEVILAAVDDVAPEFPEVRFTMANVDVVAMKMVTDPGAYDVIAAENVFGDVLSDLGAGLMGSLGLAAAANIGAQHAVFEPVHGSAPDIAGQGVANPAAFLEAAAMCGDHLGDASEAARLRSAVAKALEDPSARTPDVGGHGTTETFVAAVRSALGSAR